MQHMAEENYIQNSGINIYVCSYVINCKLILILVIIFW